MSDNLVSVPIGSRVSVDLFSGAGGLSAGLVSAGVSCRLAVDNWQPAVETFRANFPAVRVIQADAGELSAAEVVAMAGGIPTLISGGPPCQGFSSAGRRAAGDPRNSLVGIFATLVAEIRPPFVLFENVEGFLTAEGGARVFDLLDPLVEAGYRIHIRKVNAANYGVPQHRKRVVGLAALGHDPQFPLPAYSAYGAPGAHLAGLTLPMALTVADALAGLPATPEGVPSGHDAKVVSEVAASRIAHLAPGQTMKDLPEDLRHASYQRRAFRRVMDGTPSANRGGSPAGLRRLDPFQPSKAITAAAPTEFIHPTEDRPLTLRECARIQTFNDTFEFKGTYAARCILIGNAVPPALASALGTALLAGGVDSESRGRLLSFVPTLSPAMSPALRAVSIAVARRYWGRLPDQVAEPIALWG